MFRSRSAVLAQGLRGASAADLEEVDIELEGEGLHREGLDADLLVPELLRGVFGSKRWMSEVGRTLGSARSAAKAKAAGMSGRKGGRLCVRVHPSGRARRTARPPRVYRRDMSAQPKQPPKKPADSESIVSELLMPHQVNNLGHIFGGELLSMVDRAAAVAAMRHAGSAAVTVSIDRVDFREPIYTGELLTCTARVNFVGRTSMEIGVRVEAENLLSGQRRHTNTCFLTFVAIDAKHRPCAVPPLDLSDPEDERRFREGKRRREVREALDRELAAHAD